MSAQPSPKQYRFLTLLLICQLAVWIGTASVISEPHLAMWLACAVAVLTPLLTGMLVLRVYKSIWKIASSSELAVIQLRRWKYCIFSSILFILLNCVFSLSIFRDTRTAGIVVDETGRIDSSGVRVSAAAMDAAAPSEGNFFPSTLFDLVNKYHLPMEALWPLNPGELYTKNIAAMPADHPDINKGFVDSHSQFDYFGDGISRDSAPGTVILASKDILRDGRRQLVTLDNNYTFSATWVSAADYLALISQIQSHQPIQRTVLADLTKRESMLPFGD